MTSTAVRIKGFLSRLSSLAKGKRHGFLWLAASFFAPAAFAQQYVEYPQHQGKFQPLELKWVPAWATLDMDLRERTESQTGLNYVPRNLQIYGLTRVRG